MQNQIQELLLASSDLKRKVASDTGLLGQIETAAQKIIGAIRAGGTLYTCGNGGSSCDAMHFAEELVALYKRDRPGIKAMHLQDAGIISCWGNDRSFEGVFERQVATFCGPKDVLVGISTSGNSKNVIKAVEAARVKGTYSIGLLGKSGGNLAPLCDLPIIVPSKETERIQEVHITIIHILCELIETTK